MPIYEYECRKCGAVTDVRHGFDETVSTACPQCGGELARRFSPAGIVFKGSGFYVTDSRKSSATSSSSSGKSGGGDAAKTSSPSEAKSSDSSASTSSSEGSSTSPSESASKKSEGTAA